MHNIQLTKSSSESDLKRYFTAVLELSKADNKFPINLDEVWPLVYSGRNKATRALRDNFFENEDFIRVPQNGQSVRNENGQLSGSVQIDYFLSLSCMEYFIARKVRPVFEVYRQVFHRTAQQTIYPALPQTYKQALTQLLAQVEVNEQLQLENKKLSDENTTQKNIINFQAGEIETLTPKGRVYDQVIQSPQDANVFTTRQVAQEIGLTDHRLYAILMQIGILYRQSGTYMLYADYLGWGLHKMVSHTIDTAKGRVRTYLKWTTRGRAYIHALYECQWNKRGAFTLLKKGNTLEHVV